MTTTTQQLVSLDMMTNTIRRMTARYSPAQMSDTQIHNYINLAYTLRFPLEFKSLKLTKPLTFLTTPNVDTYNFVYEDGILQTPDSTVTATKFYTGNIQISPPAYCQGYPLRYFQDKSTFYNLWPKLSVNQQISVGDGSGVYSGIIPSTPFLRGQVDIFGNLVESAVIISAENANTSISNDPFVFTCTDKPQPNSNIGLLYDVNNNNIGAVDYITGNYTFVLANSAVIPAGEIIYASVVPYQSSRPTDVIFYNQQLTFRPVPQMVFQVEFQISMQPTQLIAANAAPELDEWYLFICALASELIYTDFPDPEGMAYLMPILEEQRLIAQRRSLRQMSSQRAQTIFSTPYGRNQIGYYNGSQYSGN